MSWGFYFRGHVKAARHKLHEHKAELPVPEEQKAYEDAKTAIFTALQPFHGHQFVNIDASGSGYFDGAHYHGSVSVKVEEIMLSTNEALLGVDHETTHALYPEIEAGAEVTGRRDPAPVSV